MAWGDGKRVGELEAQVANLQQWVSYLKGAEPMALAADVGRMRAELSEVHTQLRATKDAVAAARADEQDARAQLVEDLATADLQEAGFYTFNHPLDDTIAYKEALRSVQLQMKELIRTKRAVETTTSWTVNGSATKGKAMVRDFSKLLLRAYNSEADALVRALRPHTLDSAKSRLDKSASAIERLGKSMQIRIAPAYHRLRFLELELTADFLIKKQEEKEAERERRAQLRDEAKARAEMESALVKLRKEQQHYEHLLERLDGSDPEAMRAARDKLAEIGASIDGVERRSANTRAGHVYVISNLGAFGPDMVKIGMTRRLDPMDRVIELGDASVPFRFDVHALVFHEDAVTLETHLHQALADRRVNHVNTRREFFYTTPAEVRSLMQQYAGSFMLEYKENPEAVEWRASGALRRQTPTRAEVAVAPIQNATTAPHVDMPNSGELVRDRMSEGELPAETAEAPPAPSSWAPPNGDGGAKAAWYVSPDDAAVWRRWDGAEWTEETKPRG